MKTFVLLFLLLVCNISLFGQTEDTAQTLLEAGEMLYKEQKADTALIVLEKARVLLKEEQDWDAYFSATITMGNCYLNTLTGEGASTIEESITLAEQVNFDDPKILGALYHLMLVLKRNSLEAVAAMKYGELCIDNLKKVYPPDHIKLINCYIDLTTCYIQTSDWKMAEEYIKKSIIPIESQTDTSAYYRSIQCKALITLADVQHSQFKISESISTLQDALNIAEGLRDPFIVSFVQLCLGNYLQINNEIDKARFYLHKSNRFFKEKFGEDHPYVLETYKSLADNYRIQDRQKRIEYLTKAIAICETLYQENNIVVANLHIDLGYAYLNVKNYIETIKNCRKAKSLQSSSLPKYHLSKLKNYKLFYTYFKQKESFNLDSLSYYADLAANMIIHIQGENSLSLARVYNSKAWAYNYDNQPELALEYIQKSLNILGQNTSFDAVDAHTILAEIQFKNQENDSEAATAMQSMETAYQIFSELRQDETKTYEEYSNTNDLSIQFAADMYFKNRSLDNLEQLNLWSERKKGQQLKNIFNATKAEKIVGLPQNLIEKDKQLNQNLFYAEQRLLQAEEKSDSKSIAQIREVEIPKLSNELVAIKEETKNKYPEYFNLKYNTQTYKTTEIITRLNNEELLLSYNFFDHQLGGLCLILGKNEQTAAELKINADLVNRIKTLNKLLQSPTLFRRDKREKFTRLAHELYQELINPIEEYLVNKSKIIIIGDGISHYLPFEVLLKSKEIKPFNELDYLVNDFEISYHYSATLFAQSRKDTMKYDEGLLAFAPVFSEELSATYAPVTTQRSPFDTISSTYRAVDTDGNFVPLVYSLEEVNTISEMVKNKSNQKTEVLIFDEANEVNLKNKLKQPHRFVHIASHGFANLSESKFSGIACTPPADNNATEDGTLYVGEVYNLDIPADLVVLSSCESGLGKLKAGEGLIGLNRSFIYSGVPNVIFSLWKVNDKISSELMIEFYREVLDGADYGDALRQAKLKLLKNENTASPNLWSSFLLIGR